MTSRAVIFMIWYTKILTLATYLVYKNREAFHSVDRQKTILIKVKMQNRLNQLLTNNNVCIKQTFAYYASRYLQNLDLYFYRGGVKRKINWWTWIFKRHMSFEKRFFFKKIGNCLFAKCEINLPGLVIGANSFNSSVLKVGSWLKFSALPCAI